MLDVAHLWCCMSSKVLLKVFLKICEAEIWKQEAQNKLESRDRKPHRSD